MIFLEISQKSQENTCVRVSFLMKLQVKSYNFRLTQIFSCELCKIFKNIFSYKTPLVAASKYDWFYQSSFWRLCVPRMYTNLSMNDHNRKIGLGKKEMLEVKKRFICKTPSLKEFWIQFFRRNFGLNFLGGWRIMCIKSVKFFIK